MASDSSLSSDSGDEILGSAVENFNTIEPYQFEPEAFGPKDKFPTSPTPKTISQDRIGNTLW